MAAWSGSLWRGGAGTLKTNLRPAHALWAALSLGVLGLSLLPVVIASAVQDDYFHNAEHMLMAVAGLILGVPLSGIYRRLVNLMVSHVSPGIGREALNWRARAVHWGVLLSVATLDLLGMSRTVEAYVDAHPLAHAAEHFVIYGLYALFGGALFSLMDSRALAWLMTFIYLAMLLMYLADENNVMNIQF
ncbi:hypothetical protein FNU79_17475 [Deinococcus detaillensis]|uniref:Uncharacterized protein n=1 Tax=Deinococcus detaillensis TaxID=2592048 RepID=A0A553UHV5_9DEIO|nr:hypothetical protein [Deinococcus detaillensis]TSA79773.1 hypothetical protein FNU79_17475 [Deinococcus detaillensis]